jgi:hypothetical protein
MDGMCIIAICKERNLTEEEFKNCFKHNDDGFGFGFGHNNHTYALKGYMKEDEAMEVYFKTHKPVGLHVCHFRKISSGLKIPELTHPFVMSKASPSFQLYNGDENLLFHNGHVTAWTSLMMTIGIVHGIPTGELSDTRILAMALAHAGNHAAMLRHIDGKFAVVGKNSKVQYWGDFEKEKGILFSNRTFKEYGTSYVGAFSGYDDDMCGYGMGGYNGARWNRNKVDKDKETGLLESGGTRSAGRSYALNGDGGLA